VLGGNGFGNTFSFSKLIGGFSKTLGLANQIIPLYKEAKPMIENAKNAISFIKDLGNTTTSKVIEAKEKNIMPIKEKINTPENKKGPTFFL